MVSALYYERRRETAAPASDRDLRDAAESHSKIYQAIRSGSPAAACRSMNEHLVRASCHQDRERAKLAGRRHAPAATAPVRTGRVGTR